MKADAAPAGVVRITAANPSPLTLEGTNTYVAAGWVIDPGPDDAAHLEAVAAAAGGSAEGIVLTHDHADHSAGAGALARMLGAEVVRPPGDGEAGPFRVLATPGHSPDHVCLVLGRACFTGDTVLGAGSVFIPPGGNALARHLESLARLRALELDVLCPGHGPYVADPAAKIDEYLAHRLDRERRLLEALGSGLRTRDDLLDRAWSEVPAALRPAAALTLEAHLEKLEAEDRLPGGVLIDHSFRIHSPGPG